MDKSELTEMVVLVRAQVRRAQNLVSDHLGFTPQYLNDARDDYCNGLTTITEYANVLHRVANDVTALEKGIREKKDYIATLEAMIERLQ